MNLFKSECVYDAVKKDWVEQYWVNGNQVDSDTYFFIIDSEKYREDKKYEQKQENDCYECKYCRDECEEDYEVVSKNEDEFTDEQIEEINLIEETANEIENIDCGACLRNILYDLYVKGKSIGWNDHRDIIREINEDD